MNEQALAEIIAQATQAAVTAALANLNLATEIPAAEPKAPAKPAKAQQPKADPRFRTARQIEQAHKAEAKVNAKWDLKLAGGSRRVKDLTPTERKQYDAEIRACWPKGTRKSPAKA